METRNSWGMVALAGLFAITAIGIASATYFFDDDAETTITPVALSSDGKGDTDGDGLLDWQETLLGSDPRKKDTDNDGYSDKEEASIGSNPTEPGLSTSTEPGYRAPDSLPTTEALARELFVDYVQLSQKGSFTAEERDQVFAEVAGRNVTPVNLTQELTLADLKIKESASVEAYVAIMIAILRESTRVKEYELATFARTINEENFSGTPGLKEASELYGSIAKVLRDVEVPPSLGSEHLATVKSVGALAYAVALMGNWAGDPLDALSYMDAFNRAEANVHNSLENLFSVAAALLKKP